MIDDVIEAWKPDLEEVLRGCLEEVVFEEGKEWSRWAVNDAQDDLVRLIGGGDCSYDRPAIGALYASWYHPQRVSQLMAILKDYVCVERKLLRIVDLGSGTGATAWAVAILSAATRASDLPAPNRIEIAAWESSPFMEEAGRSLWRALEKALDRLRPDRPLVALDQHFVSWTDPRAHRGEADLVVGSYLFDASDSVRTIEMASAFQSVLESTSSPLGLLTTARSKQTILDRALRPLAEVEKWGMRHIEIKGLIDGSLDSLHELRKTWSDQFDIPRRWMSKTPSWSGESKVSVSEVKFNSGLERSLWAPPPHRNMLNPEQFAAADPDERLTLVKGAAGSGKSLVLTERLVRVLERPSTTNRILVTTLNKKMNRQLRRWVIERVHSSETVLLCDHPMQATPRRGSEGTICMASNGRHICVDFLHRDLPHVIFESNRRSNDPQQYRRVWNDRIAKLLAADSSLTSDARHLSVEFLEDELEMVILARDVRSLEEYLVVKRRGMGTQIQKSAREQVWSVLMDEPRPDSYVYRRIEALELHREVMDSGGHIQSRWGWTHVFVDEAQDFTEAEFTLYGSVIPDVTKMFMAGDEMQSMRLGATYRRPGTIRGRRWRAHDLLGSYRIPLRVIEALEPIADLISESHFGAADREQTDGDFDGARPESRKASTLGPRPVIVDGDEDDLCEVVAEVLVTYRRFLSGDLSETPIVSIATDGTLNRGVNTGKLGMQIPWADVRLESMLTIKGLERPALIFEVGERPDQLLNRRAELVYTALTRASNLLVIILRDNADDDLKRIFSTLKPSSLLFWSDGAKRKLEGWKEEGT